MHTAAGDGGISYGLMQTQITPGNAIDCAGTANGGCSTARILGMFKNYLYGKGGQRIDAFSALDWLLLADQSQRCGQGLTMLQYWKCSRPRRSECGVQRKYAGLS